MYRENHSPKEKHRSGTCGEDSAAKKKGSPIPVVIISTLAAALLITGMVWSSLGRYVEEKEYQRNQVVSSPFYFTVDLLGDSDTVAARSEDYSLYGGGKQEIRFSVQNFYDSLRTTAVDTTYTISFSVSDASTEGIGEDRISLLLGEDDGVGQHTLTGGRQESHDYLLKIPKYAKEQTVIVTVCSSAPYEKELVLRFALDPTAADVMYEIVDQKTEPFAELIIMTSVDIDQNDLTVDWSEMNSSDYDFQVDTTNPYVLDGLELITNKPPADGHLNQFTNTRGIHQRESISVYFFKADQEANYSTMGPLPATEISADKYSITITDAVTPYR